jgi:hypothetical protein
VQRVIVAEGGSAGYTLFVKDGRLMYESNFFGRERDLIQSSESLLTGRVTAVFEAFGGGGTGRLLVKR